MTRGSDLCDPSWPHEPLTTEQSTRLDALCVRGRINGLDAGTIATWRKFVMDASTVTLRDIFLNTLDKRSARQQRKGEE